MGAFGRQELVNELSKSHKKHRRCWVDPARHFMNGVCRAEELPEIASTRRTYPPPCPPPQGGRKRFWYRGVAENALVYCQSFCPFLFLRIEKTLMIRVALPPSLWERQGGGVPKNKIAAERSGSLPPETRIGRLIWHSYWDALALTVADLFSSTHVSKVCSRSNLQNSN